jgi:outer membrane protein assembly factor BamB
MKTLFKTLMFGAVISLTACSVFKEKEEYILPGERISIMELQQSLEPDAQELNAGEIVIPGSWKNAFWPQAGGYPNHAMQNLALNNGPLTKVWSTDIGDGSSDELPLNAQPIVVDGRIFTLDTDSSLRSHNAANGKLQWKVDVASEAEDDGVISGGIGYGDKRVFVTNGYNEILAILPEDGRILWRKKIASPSRAAPSVLNGQVYVATLDNRLTALDVETGAFLWDFQGANETAGLVGAASPALDGEMIVAVFSSGELAALRAANGSLLWGDNLSNLRRIGQGGGMIGLADIKGLPVIDNGIVVAVSFSGKLVAIDQVTGVRIWQREISGSETPWVAANVIYVLSSDNQLIALGRDSGVIYWVTDLQQGTDSIVLSGPIMAGGRLIVVGTDGLMIEVNPQDGSIANSSDLGSDILIAPIVANEHLYVLNENGTLTAYK